MIGNGDLNAWPSDICYQRKRPEKFNIVEFYHKILWSSQQEHYNNATKGERRVTFSKDPPEIFEYASEYSRSSPFQSIFNKHRFTTDDYTIKQVLHASYYNGRSYNPIPNNNYQLKHDEDRDLDPPPSYQEKPLSLKRRISQQFNNEKPVAFFRKTLRKIKSTPKLRRDSVISLRKKASFI